VFVAQYKNSVTVMCKTSSLLCCLRRWFCWSGWNQCSTLSFFPRITECKY